MKRRPQILLTVVAVVTMCGATARGQTFPLSFPLHDGPSVDPWSAVIIGVMDHSMTKAYAADGRVVTFTGEVADRNPAPVAGTTHFKFANAQGTSFFVNGNYRPGVYLNYDGHPGIDYYTGGQNVTVYAAADGTTLGRAGCQGEVVLDIGGGYVTRYIHLDSLDSSVTDGTGQYAVGKFVARGTPLGTAGGRACSGPSNAFPVQLHFEVRKGNIPVDPYGWEGNLAGNGDDPYRPGLPGLNVNLWGPRPVDWSANPPTAVPSGTSFSVFWIVTGEASATELHYDSVEDVSVVGCTTRSSCQSACSASGAGTFSCSITAPMVSRSTAYYFAAHATVNGREYYTPLAQVRITPPGGTCSGDCGGVGTVTVNDLITIANIVLGKAQPSVCANGVRSDAPISVALIIQAVNSALNGCAID